MLWHTVYNGDADQNRDAVTVYLLDISTSSEQRHAGTQFNV